MSKLKKTQVVMLPTNQKAQLIKDFNNKLIFNYNNVENLRDNYTFQHLYFLSDEEIKEGDYVYIDLGLTNSRITQVVKLNVNNNEYCVKVIEGYAKPDALKKVITTTDKTLVIESSVHLTGKWFLPQPSQSFIEKYVEEYNKGNQIKEVMVEYYFTHETAGDKPLCVKVAKDNTITIRPIKDSWNREEVIELITKGIIEIGSSVGLGDNLKLKVNKWIEENL